MSALSPSPLLGGRFHLGEKLGGSGGTETWRATEAGSGRICTVLILDTGDASPEAVAERVRAAGAVQHPSILPTLDVGVTDDGRVFVVREQMPGGNLAAYVRRNGPLPPRKAAAVVRGLVAALDAAHTHGLVHGEVEPAKVSVGADNKPRLTGFGLTGVPPRAERPFAAPEATDPSSADAYSDVYSAGATLYTLVTGKAPAGLSESELGEGALAAIPGALGQVIHRATRRDPRDRYPSAAAMLTDLKAIAVVLPPGSGQARVTSEPQPTRAAPTIAISLDAPLPEVSGRDEDTPTQLFDRDVIKMALGDLDRSALGDLRPAIEAMGPADEPSVATMPAGGADLEENLETAPVAMNERRKPPPTLAIAVVTIGVAACIALALYLTREPSSPPPEVAPETEPATTSPPPRLEAPPPPVAKPAPAEPVAPPPVAVEPPKPAETPKAAETPHASSAAKKKPKAANPVIAPAPIDVEEDGDMNPRITPTVPPPAEATPPADAPTTPAPEAEEQIWDTPPAAPAETPPAATAPAETPPADAAPAEPAPAAPAAAPAEPTTTEPPATEPAPAN
jgi:serine/threonine protein kinase